MREEIERSPEYDNREIISVFTDSDHKNSRSWCQRVLFGEGEGGVLFMCFLNLEMTLKNISKPKNIFYFGLISVF
jgi:hypothetical protein